MRCELKALRAHQPAMDAKPAIVLADVTLQVEMRTTGTECASCRGNNTASFHLRQQMQQLTYDAADTGRRRRSAREIDKSLDRDYDLSRCVRQVLANFGCAIQPGDRDLLKTNLRDIASGSKDDPDRIRLSVEFIILLELTPKPSGFCADDRVVSRVIGKAPVINLDADHVLFELILLA